MRGPRNWILELIPPDVQCPTVEIAGRVHDLVEQAFVRVQISIPVCPHICQGSRLAVAQKPHPQYTEQDRIDVNQEAAVDLGEEPKQLSYQRLDRNPSVNPIQERSAS